MYGKFAEDINLFKERVSSSSSIKEILEVYELPIHNSYYKFVKQACQELNIEYPIYDYKNNIVKNEAIPLVDVLVENSTYKNIHLKKRLIKEGLLVEECYQCKITHWYGQKLSLQLDHINGVNNDNRLENLRLLCPNCHSLTETYAGKNKTKSKKCIICNKSTNTKSTMHHSCRMNSYHNPNNSKPKIDWPSLHELENLLRVSNYVQVGKQLGVSDNAVRKHLKKLRSENPAF